MTKEKFSESIEIPKGISCIHNGFFIICKNDSLESKREIRIPKTSIKIEDNHIKFENKKAGRNEIKKIRAVISHLNNIFSGLDKPYVYKLTAVNVHFPMSLKLEKNKLMISNFLGEKIARTAKVLPNVNVEIKGQDIKISSFEKEAAGQTAANFEKATKINNKDRRIFQDGIYITEKPGDKKHE